MSELETQFLQQVKAARLPEPVTQFKFHPEREFKADFCWPDIGLIVEIDGGGHMGGRHNREAGRTRDCQRDAEATLLGFTVYRCTSSLVRSGKAIKTTELIIDYLMGLEATE